MTPQDSYFSQCGGTGSVIFPSTGWTVKGNPGMAFVSLPFSEDV